MVPGSACLHFPLTRFVFVTTVLFSPPHAAGDEPHPNNLCQVPLSGTSNAQPLAVFWQWCRKQKIEHLAFTRALSLCPRTPSNHITFWQGNVLSTQLCIYILFIYIHIYEKIGAITLWEALLPHIPVIVVWFQPELCVHVLPVFLVELQPPATVQNHAVGWTDVSLPELLVMIVCVWFVPLYGPVSSPVFPPPGVPCRVCTLWWGYIPMNLL